MKKRNVFLLFIIFILILTFFNIKNIMKKFYPYNYSEYIELYSKQRNEDPLLIAAIIKAESNYNVNAKSNKNAYGLMQLTPETAEWIAEKIGIENFSLDMLYDPEINISMGCWYVQDLYNEFKDTNLVLAAYNAGRGRVGKWLKNPRHSRDGKNLHYIPFKETDKYVKKVRVNFNIYKSLYGSKKASRIDLVKSIFENINIKYK